MICRKYKFFLSFVALILLPSVIAHAQNARLSGRITDTNKMALKDADILIQQIGTEQIWQVQSNHEGRYTLPALLPGSYRITVSAPHFASQQLDHVQVNVAGNLTLDFSMNVGSEQQSIVVDGSAASLDTTTPTVSTVIDHVFVGNMPLNGRSFQSLLTLSPGVLVVPSQGLGVSGEISVNGQRTEANSFTVDGISVNTGISATGVVGQGAGYGGATPGETAIGGTQSMVGVDALQEFRASTSSYSAQYGRVPGGQFTFLSRSGNDQWHGAGFEYLRNEGMDANNWFNNALGVARLKTRQHDFGGILGGYLPYLQGGRNYIFAAYEGMMLETPSAAQQYQVPSSALRNATSGTLQAILNAFPLPDSSIADLGNGLAYSTHGYSSPSRVDTGSLRIDRDLQQRMHTFVRYQKTDSVNTGRLAANIAETMPLGVNVQSLTLGATQVIRHHINNDARFNLTWNDSSVQYLSTTYGGATAFNVNTLTQLMSNPYNRLYVGMNFGSVPNFSYLPQATSQRQINITDWMSASFGRHTLTWGFDYLRLNDEARMPLLYAPVVYSSAAQLKTNTPGSNALAKIVVPALYPIYNKFSAFVQEEWHINDRLTTSLGLRWEINPSPHDGAGNDPYTVDQIANLATTKLAPKGTPQWSTQYTAISPRFGIDYTLHSNTNTQAVLRAGFGLYNDTTVANATGGYAREGYRTTARFTSQPFPLTAAQIDSVSAPSTAAPYTETIYTTDPHLKMPYSYQYNLTYEQQLGPAQTLQLSYVGSSGHKLLATRAYSPSVLGNKNFGSSSIYLMLTKNTATSSYNALQAQFQRRLAQGVQLQAACTWSHAIDDLTSNFQVYELQRASSDYDVHHNFQMALTYDLHFHHSNPILNRMISDWQTDLRISARSSLPIDVVGQSAVIDSADGETVNFHPNRVTSQPLYIRDTSYTARSVRRINPAAFVAATLGTEGNVGRNYARGFDAIQTDLALRRQITLRKNLQLQLRAESFNLFNHPILGSVYNTMTNTSFGRVYSTLNNQLGGLNALHQQGGPRSMQLTARIQF